MQGVAKYPLYSANLSDQQNIAWEFTSKDLGKFYENGAEEKNYKLFIHMQINTHIHTYIYIIYTCSHAIYLCLATLGPKSPGLGQHSLLSLFLTPLHSSRSNQSRDVEDWDRRQPKEFARTL